MPRKSSRAIWSGKEGTHVSPGSAEAQAGKRAMWFTVSVRVKHLSAPVVETHR